jgi:hypothetical protein
MLRSMLGAIGLGAVLRPFVLQRVGGVVDGRRITSLLGLLAFLSVACFFNLGRAQFWDAKQRQPSFIHNYDMRVYFPVAKYFQRAEVRRALPGQRRGLHREHPGRVSAIAGGRRAPRSANP